MKGTVKFYNREKGFGFIYTDEHEGDIYFRIAEWKNPSAPNANDDIEFEIKETKKGAVAVKIKCVQTDAEKKEKKRGENRSDDPRIICPGCRKKMVPRMIIRNGEPHHSVCPYCARTIKEFSNCFIASAVYADEHHANVTSLRHFRDNVLSKSCLGNRFINFYYKKSPPIAEKLKNKKVASWFVRILLNTFVFVYNKVKH